MEERLQKYIARCGVASRRKSEELILAGKIKVNGIVITELGKAFLEGLTKSPAKLLADISQTTKWEEQLKENPELFLENKKNIDKFEGI